MVRIDGHYIWRLSPLGDFGGMGVSLRPNGVSGVIMVQTLGGCRRYGEGGVVRRLLSWHQWKSVRRAFWASRKSNVAVWQGWHVDKAAPLVWRAVLWPGGAHAG